VLKRIGFAVLIGAFVTATVVVEAYLSFKDWKAGKS
jgi:hypothetical protein